MLERVRRSLALVLAVALIAACAPSVPEADASKGQIRVDMREYAMSATSTEMTAGQVTFIARNAGSNPHELIVIRADAAPDKLPLDSPAQKAKEDGKVGGVVDIGPGKSMNLRLQLPAGHYVLICNVPTHYQLGMRTELTIR